MIGTAKGLPGGLLLVFSILIWILFILIYLSNPRNKLNFWCFLSGLFFSTGVFKEYLYFSLAPDLIARYPELFSISGSLELYSVLTAVLYYFSMPTVMVFSLYFCHMDVRRPELFRWARLLVYAPCLIYAIFCPYTMTRDYQLYSDAYYISVALYNWLYGILSTCMICYTLREERLSVGYRQRKMVAVIVLAPIWYWLITAFLIHIMGFQSLFKVWQGNLFVILALLCYYLRNVFKEGIWGMRLRREQYDWTDDAKAIRKNAQYVGHALKNEIAKIEWCMSIVRERGSGENKREFEIIDRSVRHLKEFIDKTRIYSDEIVLKRELCDISSIFGKCTMSGGTSGIKFEVGVCSREPLSCDRAHVTEALNNLIRNAAEAAGEEGTIRLAYRYEPDKRQAVIEVADDGSGIGEEAKASLFDPYYTTKATNHHLGLGLYYCYNVMKAHGGCIQVDSEPGRGSRFLLYFPVRKEKRKQRIAAGAPQ